VKPVDAIQPAPAGWMAFFVSRAKTASVYIDFGTALDI
jgi:hypothetical protein